MDRNILLPPIIIRDIIVPIGLFGNALILLTTIRAKSLRNNCNILIATQALFDLLTGLTDVIVYYQVYSNHLAISYYLCFGLLLIPSITGNISVMGYNKFNRKYYMMAMYMPGIMLNAAFITMSAINFADRVTFCLRGSFYSGTINLAWFGTMATINLCVIITYIYLYRLVRNTNANDASTHLTKKIFRSILTIMIATIGTWFVGTGTAFVAILSGYPPLTILYVATYAGCFPLFGISSNFYIYYYQSTDYRREFLRFFKYLCCRKTTNDSIFVGSRVTPHQ